MAAGIYKPGQGYWTRVMSAIAAGVIVLMGAMWLWKHLARVQIEGLETVYVQAIGAVILVLVFGTVGFFLIGRQQRFVEFLIATEGEMKKVNWSSRREIFGSTRVVIGLTLFIAILCKLFDLGFTLLFAWMGVLKTGA